VKVKTKVNELKALRDLRRSKARDVERLALLVKNKELSSALG